MSEQATDSIVGAMRLHVNKELLKYAVGRAIFCPQCQGIMDCRRTVVSTLYRRLEGKEEELVQNWVLCASCWDKARPRVDVTLALVGQEHPELNARLEIVDGREVFSKRRAK